MMDLLSDVKLLRKDGSESPAESLLNNKLVALYFSAKWCPPCRQFTPKLAELHEELVKRKALFEVLFVSCDKSEEDMLSYMREQHGDWAAVPFNSKARESLKSHYEIELIPKLLIASPGGELVSSLGRKEVEDRGVAALRGWLNAAGISSARAKTHDFTKEEVCTETNTITSSQHT